MSDEIKSDTPSKIVGYIGEVPVYSDTYGGEPGRINTNTSDMTNIIAFPVQKTRIGGSCDVCGSPRVDGEIKHLSDCKYAGYYDKIWFAEDGTRCAAFIRPIDEVGY